MRIHSDVIFLSLTVIYLGDIAVRAYGLSLRTFIRSRWNLFDMLTVLGSLITTVIVLVIGQLDGSASQQAAASVQKVSLVGISFCSRVDYLIFAGLSGSHLAEAGTTEQLIEPAIQDVPVSGC